LPYGILELHSPSVLFVLKILLLPHDARERHSSRGRGGGWTPAFEVFGSTQLDRTVGMGQNSMAKLAAKVAPVFLAMLLAAGGAVA
jgi:hypothetical protein